MIVDFFTRLFKQKKVTKTFTFYLPAPPARNTPYREKYFDKLMYEFLSKGHEVISINTESHGPSEGNGGLWIIVLVRATNKQAQKLDLEVFEINKSLESREFNVE